MKKPTASKDLNKLIDTWRKHGATFHKGRKHGRLMLPNGRFVIVSISPSDSRRTVKNVRQQLKREMAL